MQADDKDGNAIFFVLVNEEDSMAYSINGVTGALRLAKNIAQEPRSTHKLRVIAYDNGENTIYSMDLFIW